MKTTCYQYFTLTELRFCKTVAEQVSIKPNTVIVGFSNSIKICSHIISVFQGIFRNMCLVCWFSQFLDTESLSSSILFIRRSERWCLITKLFFKDFTPLLQQLRYLQFGKFSKFWQWKNVNWCEKLKWVIIFLVFQSLNYFPTGKTSHFASP